LTAHASGFQDAALRVHVDGGQTQRVKIQLPAIDLHKGIAACSNVHTPTETIVLVDADPEVRSQTDTLHLLVEGLGPVGGALRADECTQVADRAGARTRPR
jgi:hypothetical protein